MGCCYATSISHLNSNASQAKGLIISQTASWCPLSVYFCLRRAATTCLNLNVLKYQQRGCDRCPETSRIRTARPEREHVRINQEHGRIKGQVDSAKWYRFEGEKILHDRHVTCFPQIQYHYVQDPGTFQRCQILIAWHYCYRSDLIWHCHWLSSWLALAAVWHWRISNIDE